MKSLFKRLKERKGFTLVECIVAIAVFAAFCLMVMMIIAGAQRESKSAYDTEKELNTLIDNVMDDDIDRKYNSSASSTKTLSMSFDGDASGDFAITYDVVDGHKNYLVCDKCEYFAPNVEFCPDDLTEHFIPTAMNYVCPMCDNDKVKVTLKCADCGETGKYDVTTSFSYKDTSGSYVCVKCGSANVSSTEAQAMLFEKSRLSVSGMAANAIRYGYVEKPEYNSAVLVTDSTGAPHDDAKATVCVDYADPTDATTPGTYTVTINGIKTPNLGTVPGKDADGNDIEITLHTKVTISLPSGYYVDGFTVDADPDNVSLVQPGYDDGVNGSIIWTSTDTDSDVILTFKLRNYKTGFSFDYDYQQIPNAAGTGYEAGGLAKYWFSLTNDGGSASWPRAVPTT